MQLCGFYTDFGQCNAFLMQQLPQAECITAPCCLHPASSTPKQYNSYMMHKYLASCLGESIRAKSNIMSVDLSH